MAGAGVGIERLVLVDDVHYAERIGHRSRLQNDCKRIYASDGIHFMYRNLVYRRLVDRESYVA